MILLRVVVCVVGAVDNFVDSYDMESCIFRLKICLFAQLLRILQ